MNFDVATFDVKKFDRFLARGLCQGVGAPDAQMCIEAAICATLDLPHGDDPKCVAASVRHFKIALNDSSWSSHIARAQGLRALGLAQLGSKGVVDDTAFTTTLQRRTIQILIPHLFRQINICLPEALRCEQEGTRVSAADAADAVYTVYAAGAARAGYAANAASAADAASSLPKDFYLRMVAALALDTLRELRSPGIALLDEDNSSTGDV